MKKKTKKLIIIFGVVGVIAASPWLLGIAFLSATSVYGKIDESIYDDRSVFSSEKWKAGNKKIRFTYIDALLEGKVLKEKEKFEVRAILGDPDFIEEGKIWNYETKRPGWRLIDFTGGGVSVEFDENNNVKEVKDTRWID